MAVRPRHKIKELEDILQEAESKGWRVTKGKRYYMMWCPCEEKHTKTVRLTPSSPHYAKALIGELKRKCW